MMLPIELGVDLNTNQKIFVPFESFATHYHLVGATGAGKTTTLNALFRPIFSEPRDKSCVFIIDAMGGQTRDILRWMASRQCPEHVRRRLLLIEPAREEYVLPFNPLHYTSEANFYYQVARAVDLILRAWAAQDLSLQPRLMQWSYKALCAMAAMNFPIAMSRFLLHPGTDEHLAILQQIPGEIRYHWAEILGARTADALRCLESTRNRFDPFYESCVLRRMFGVTQSRFDCERFIRERRIVLVNLARLGKVPSQLAHTIGSLIVNEVFETAYGMSTRCGRSTVAPLLLVLDEFQNYMSPDIEMALPTVRQMGLSLVLAHQSFSQLKKSDLDLTSMIWQARSKLFFANMAEDADIVANELATLTFDPMKIKDERRSLKQLIIGYRKEWLESQGVSNTHGSSTIDQRSVGYHAGEGRSQRLGANDWTTNTQRGDNQAHITGGTHADSESNSHSRSQANVPIHETIEEVVSKTFFSFEEQRLEWMRIVRELLTGEILAKFVNDKRLYHIQVTDQPVEETKRLDAAVQELVAKNFEQDVFISAQEADRLAELDRDRLLAPLPIIVPGEVVQPSHPSDESQSSKSLPDAEQPFRKRKRSS